MKLKKSRITKEAARKKLMAVKNKLPKLQANLKTMKLNEKVI